MKFLLFLILVTINITLTFGSCVSDEDCGQGKCFNTTCRCTKPYAGDNCDYERKHKLTVFLISFLAGETGADRFYLGYIGLGVGKLILLFVPCVMSYALFCTLACLQESGFAVFGFYLCIMIMSYIATFAWWLADWIVILSGDMHDAQGYGLWNNM